MRPFSILDDSRGYADFLASDPEAVENLALITSHGFFRGTYGHWFVEHNSYTNAQ
jgi:hypothetical protein